MAWYQPRIPLTAGDRLHNWFQKQAFFFRHGLWDETQRATAGYQAFIRRPEAPPAPRPRPAFQQLSLFEAEPVPPAAPTPWALRLNARAAAARQWARARGAFGGLRARLFGNRPAPSPPPGAGGAGLWMRAAGFARRHPWGVGLGAGIALLGAGYLIGLSRSRKETTTLPSNRPTTRVDYYVQRFR